VVYIFGSQNSNLAKLASDWLKKSARGKLWQNPRDKLQNTELCTKLGTKLCKSSTKGFAAPLSTQCTGYTVNGVRSAQGGPRGSPP
jgi:hypothetical protein